MQALFIQGLWAKEQNQKKRYILLLHIFDRTRYISLTKPILKDPVIKMMLTDGILKIEKVDRKRAIVLNPDHDKNKRYFIIDDDLISEKFKCSE